MNRFSKSHIAQTWLGRFSDRERDVAALLLDEILLVNGSDFRRGIESLMQYIQEGLDDSQSAAFYAEREVEIRERTILPIFQNIKNGRASGDGPDPVPHDRKQSEVGSEGILANIITSHCRYYGKSSLSHPGPDRMRKSRCRAIVIVTDFVGSGNRVWKMLEAFRATPTIRSWKSYRLTRFYVIAYSGTESGIDLVKSSRLRPEVLTFCGCPTIYSSFSGKRLESVKEFCREYPPEDRSPLGYRSAGALIAFEHGIPNNAPPILYKGWGDWQPLFQRRSTIRASSNFPIANEAVVDRAKGLLKFCEAAEYFANPRGRRWGETMLVLAAIEAGARSVASISAQSRLDIASVREIIGFTQSARWTTPVNRLTPLGRSELKRLRRRRSSIPGLPKQEQPYYYPKQLRAR